MSNDSRWRGVLERPSETGSVLGPADGSFPLMPAPPLRRSIAISVISAVVALVYACSPIDLVPEALVPLVGFVDDVLIFIGGTVLAGAMLVAALSERARYREALREYEETEPFYGKWSP